MYIFVSFSLNVGNINDPDINNGLITTIWGPHVWESFNAVAFGFPVNPTEQQKKEYLEHYL